jgi:hypothetical protein
MKGEVEVTGPEIAMTLGTRAALGIGLGLLLAGRFSEESRRAVGWTLLLAGAFSGTVLASELFGRPRPLHMKFGSAQNGVVHASRQNV